MFSINPKQLDRFRDCYTAAGAKDDSRDAYVAADALRTQPDCRQHRDAGILLSLPGVGCIIAANLLSEGSDPLGQRDYYALRNHSGVAPVTKQSGKSKQVAMRRGCSERLRNVMYHWARTSVQHDPLSKHHYARLRQAGHKHARALRGVADRLLAILIAMLRSGQPYDATRRRNAVASTPAA